MARLPAYYDGDDECCCNFDYHQPGVPGLVDPALAGSPPPGFGAERRHPPELPNI
ncbi:hypothetical protein GRI40_09890 [Altererythrobacter aerius]|uniref:Uncharacterized protein n=1 Tax=Tsuneonella aeria TaxID=1837929 RepID=A0A6I4TFU2_9SPHN|nr:hypothetical protein [Tsuneonella aeria]MXO75526.1 hypothetical protein [Tsuneonella aeria]